MTEEQLQGKFEITEFKLAGSKYRTGITVLVKWVCSHSPSRPEKIMNLTWLSGALSRYVLNSSQKLSWPDLTQSYHLTTVVLKILFELNMTRLRLHNRISDGRAGDNDKKDSTIKVCHLFQNMSNHQKLYERLKFASHLCSQISLICGLIKMSASFQAQYLATFRFLLNEGEPPTEY